MFMRTSTSLFIKRILYENINAKKLDSSFMQLRNIRLVRNGFSEHDQVKMLAESLRILPTNPYFIFLKQIQILSVYKISASGGYTLPFIRDKAQTTDTESIVRK